MDFAERLGQIAIDSNDNDLCAPLSDMNGLGCGTRLTRYRELARFGGPILIEELLEVNLVAVLFLLCQKKVTTLRFDVHAHLECRRNIPIYSKA